jgi:hypothetical protein
VDFIEENSVMGKMMLPYTEGAWISFEREFGLEIGVG